MEPTDRATNPAGGPSQADRDAAQAAQARRRADGRFNRQLEQQEDHQQRRIPRRNALEPNPGLRTQLFAEAAERQTIPPARAAAAPDVADSVSDVLVSVHNRNIGSVYFPHGRVRTTHHAGPGMSVLPPGTILRFNINHAEAMQAFRDARPEALNQALTWRDRTQPPEVQRLAVENEYLDERDAWLGELLSNPETLPTWAQAVTGPESVGHVDDVPQNSDRVLFEVYDRGPERGLGTHISRGEAARMPMAQSTVTAISEAVRLTEHIQDPVRRNEAFYDYLGSHAPDFAMMIRRPDPPNPPNPPREGDQGAPR
jgi:hypothetical protein